MILLSFALFFFGVALWLLVPWNVLKTPKNRVHPLEAQNAELRREVHVLTEVIKSQYEKEIEILENRLGSRARQRVVRVAASKTAEAEVSQWVNSLSESVVQKRVDNLRYHYQKLFDREPQ